MSENRTIVRVFLASPGDLGDERRAARDAVEEVNRTVAKPQGYQIDLYGWEDTISAAGRPQAIINEELRQCELFVGMLWAKWGTPPDNDGIYSSGFEEEFSIAAQMQRTGGVPEMRMYFKSVDDARIKDPGPELSRVLAFRDRLIAEKRILFDKFDDPADFARRLRIGLADYINRKFREKQEDATESDAPRVKSKDNITPSIDRDVDSKPKAQASFLMDIANQLEERADQETLSASHIARLRLVGMAHIRSGNDEPEIGPHDANLLYRERKTFDYEPSDFRALARTGLGAFTAQNKPLWFWVSSVIGRNPYWLVFETWSDRSAERKGAFAVARLTRIDLKVPEPMDRKQLVSHWLKRGDDEAQKDALRYLKHCGRSDDLPIILEKMESAPGQISREMIEAALSISSRYDMSSAVSLLIRTPFDSIDNRLMDIILDLISTIDNEQLALAIEHRSGRVREYGLREMIRRGTTSAELGHRFSDDGYLPVRKLALLIIEIHEGRLSDSAVNSILVKPKKSGIASALLLGTGGYDSEGNRAYEAEKFDRLSDQPKQYLQSVIENGEIDSDLAYFAIIKRNFSAHCDELRKNFDDRFVEFFKADVERTAKRVGSSTRALQLIEKIKEGEGWKRKELMDRGLALLLSKSDRQDLIRVRSAIDDNSIRFNTQVVNYLADHGDWSDITRLAEIAPKSSEDGLSLLSLGRGLFPECASAIYKIAKGRISELLEMRFQPILLANLIALLNQSEFKSINDEKIYKLLLSENEELRKVTALKAIVSLSSRRVRHILNEHLSGERYFYNVVFWLDLVLAFPNRQARQIAKEVLHNSE